MAQVCLKAAEGGEEVGEVAWSQSGSHVGADECDYHGKSSAQNPRQRHLVLYNAAGTNIAAAYCDQSAFKKLPLLVEHKCYRAGPASVQEAHYLAAVLNASSLNLLIKPFQSSGLLGERDIEKRCSTLPLFDEAEPLHRELSELGAACHMKAQSLVDSAGLTHARSLARSRKQVRDLLAPEMEEIDKRVMRLLS